MQPYFISALIAVVSLILGAVSIVSAFRADVKVLSHRIDALVQSQNASREADKAVLDLRLEKIAVRVEDIAHFIGVDRRQADNRNTED